MRHPLVHFLLATPFAAFAQSSLEAERTTTPQILERVEIVGSRLPRIDAETALPVQIVHREEIDRSGVTNVEELLERITANFAGHGIALGLGDASTPGLSGASLRGFGAGETLVLLNGRRLANYAFSGTGGQGVDLNAIPLAAIERVEVLKDGASALYGSDAIAGVINFVTRRDYAGTELMGRATRSERGGGDKRRATLALGHGDLQTDGHNAFFVLDAQSADRLRAADRPFAATSSRPELGLDGVAPQSYPANIIRRDANGIRFLVNPAAPACPAATVRRGNACWFDYTSTIDLLPRSRQLSGLGRVAWRLDPQTELYAEALASQSRVRFTSSPSPASASVSQAGARFILPAASPYYPTGLGLSGDLLLALRTAPLGGRTTEVESRNARVVTGLRSQLAAWDVDAAIIVNDSRANERYVSGTVDAGRLSAAIGSGLVNPFGPSGAEGDALLAGAELSGPAREARGRTRGADLRASREFDVLPAGPLGLAAGIEVRNESLRDRQLRLVTEVIGGVPAAPKQGSRTAQAAYVELLVPIVKALEVQLAARVDRYSDFGSAVSPKLALRLQPVRDWLLRASIGRGFRAPSLPELYTQQASGFVELANYGVADPVRCPVTGLPIDCQPEVTTTDGGNPALRPQRSTQANLGLVIAPLGAWQASLDFWSVRVRDIIGALRIEDVVADLVRYDGRNVVRGPVDPATPGLPGPIVQVLTLNQNLGDWQVRGADLALAMRPTSTSIGSVSLRLDGTYVTSARQRIFEGNEIDLVGRVAPRWQHLLTAQLDHGPWSATLSQRYRRSYDDFAPLPDGTTRRVAAYRVWNSQLAYAFSRDVRAALGVNNLFDTDPPFTNQRSSFQVGYDPAYANPLGRTWMVELRVAWR